MYLWQRLAAPAWWSLHQEELEAIAGDNLAVIDRPGRKRSIIEVSCRSLGQSDRLRKQFGGRITKLAPDWLKKFARSQEMKPLQIGKRLVITNSELGRPVGKSHRVCSASGSVALSKSLSHRDALQTRSQIVIPAGPAFGTGHHPTTAMSLRMLEQLTRSWTPGWSMVDLGTGSGIFAIAARRFGAGNVTALDKDPLAISTAKANARLNNESKIQFLVTDVRHWRPPAGVDVLTANLFSELLIQVVPKVRRIPRLILSGIMRNQERDVSRALRRIDFKIRTVRRRGKWLAMLVAR
jgi:ribosomal protein L11 methyltransferase